MTLLERYLQFVCSFLQPQGQELIFAPLVEANMTADIYNSGQLLIIVNTRSVTCSTTYETQTSQFRETYSFQIWFVRQHPQSDDFEDINPIYTETEKLCRNFQAQLTYDNLFASTMVGESSVSIGTRSFVTKAFDANMSGWALDLTITLDIDKAFCYACCQRPDSTFQICETNC